MALIYKYVLHANQDTCLEDFDSPVDICPAHRIIMDLDSGTKFCILCETKLNNDEPSHPSPSLALHIRTG
jgi:hypothetical protein